MFDSDAGRGGRRASSLARERQQGCGRCTTRREDELVRETVGDGTALYHAGGEPGLDSGAAVETRGHAMASEDGSWSYGGLPGQPDSVDSFVHSCDWADG